MNKLKEKISRIIHPITGASSRQISPIVKMIQFKDDYIKELEKQNEKLIEENINLVKRLSKAGKDKYCEVDYEVI